MLVLRWAEDREQNQPRTHLYCDFVSNGAYTAGNYNVWLQTSFASKALGRYILDRRSFLKKVTKKNIWV